VEKWIYGLKFLFFLYWLVCLCGDIKVIYLKF